MFCKNRADVDFIKDGLELTNSSKGVILHVGGNSIRNRDGTFERSEILLKKYRELLVSAKETGKACVSGILPRLSKKWGMVVKSNGYKWKGAFVTRVWTAI